MTPQEQNEQFAGWVRDHAAILHQILPVGAFGKAVGDVVQDGGMITHPTGELLVLFLWSQCC